MSWEGWGKKDAAEQRKRKQLEGRWRQEGEGEASEKGWKGGRQRTIDEGSCGMQNLPPGLHTYASPCCTLTPSQSCVAARAPKRKSPRQEPSHPDDVQGATYVPHASIHRTGRRAGWSGVQQALRRSRISRAAAANGTGGWVGQRLATTRF